MRKRIAIGAACVAGAVVLSVMYAPPIMVPPQTAVRSDGGAAVRAPAGPQLPDPGTRIMGAVVDGAGVPVALAQVSAEPEAGIVDRALAVPADAGVSVSTPTGVVATVDAGVSQGAPTGLDGRFVIGGLQPGRYRVRVSGADLLAAELRMVAVPADDLRIVVARQVSIEGTVTDGGKPVVGANVGIRGDAIGGTLEVKSDIKGGFA